MADNGATPTVSIDAIRTAFLLGWSIVDLRNRVLISAFSSSMDVKTFQILHSLDSRQVSGAAQSASPGPNTQQGSQEVISDPIDNYKPGASAVRAYRLVHAMMRERLGQDVRDALLPLITNVYPSSNNQPILSRKAGEDAWMTSMWRTLFNRIVALHTGRFSSDASGTIYDVPLLDKDSQQNELTAYPFRYLYPRLAIHSNDPKSVDYPDIGIVSNDGLKGIFHLYEVTRRALNSLIILFTNPEESLIPEDMQAYRWWAVEDILRPAEQVQGVDSTQPQSNDDTRIVIKILAGLIWRFLGAWDNFLRENYFVDASTQQQGDGSKSNREIELTAYEAGRALSSLSWDVSATIAPLETVVKAVSPDQLSKDVEVILTKQVRTTFRGVFNGIDIATIQRQISGLSTTLDDIYYSNNPSVQRPAADDSLLQSNPDLPSESIQAITMSLRYWQRTIEQLCPEDAKNQAPAPSPASVAPQAEEKPAVQQKSPGTLFDSIGSSVQKVGQFVIRPFTLKQQASVKAQQAGNVTSTPIDWTDMLTWETSQSLRQALVRQSYTWQSLLLCEQNLSSFTVEKVTQQLLTDFMDKVEQFLLNSNLGRNFPVVAWITFIVLVILVIILVIASVYLGQNFAAVLVFVLGGVFGFIANAVSTIWTGIFPSAVVAKPGVSSPTSPVQNAALDRVSAVLGQAGSVLVEVFQDAYKRILIEFDYLDHAVSVASPLLMFFVNNTQGFIGDRSIKNGYDFLVNVIWNDEEQWSEEVDNVVFAAFGPIGALIKNGQVNAQGQA